MTGATMPAEPLFRGRRALAAFGTCTGRMLLIARPVCTVERPCAGVPSINNRQLPGIVRQTMEWHELCNDSVPNGLTQMPTVAGVGWFPGTAAQHKEIDHGNSGNDDLPARRRRLFAALFVDGGWHWRRH